MPGISYIPLLFVTATQAPSPDLQRHIYPLSKPIAAPEIVVDLKEAPEAEAWSKIAVEVTREWFPIICTLLATEDYKAPKKLTIRFAKEQDAPAYATGIEGGALISVSAKWIKQRPDDFGMMVHEATHIVQGYPRNRAGNFGWLVEGIADYVRWWRYEPESPRPVINKEKNKYTDAYRTTSSFLAWASRKYNMSLVPALDRELRKGNDPMPKFKELTGKTAQELWDEMVG